MATKTNREKGSTGKNVNNVNIVNVLGKVLPDKTIIEAVYDPKTGNAHLLVQDETGIINEVSEYSYGNTVYRPLIDSVVKQGRILLPTDLFPDKNPNKLLEDIQGVIHKFVQLDPGFEEASARYVLMTYAYDDFQKIPYIRLMGPWASGKSRFLDVMTAVSYHSSNLGEGFSPANIYRWIDRYPGTLMLDEADFEGTQSSGLITQILNGGYDRNGSVVRSFATKEDYEPRAYSSFGPKVIASHYPYKNDSLESRFLTSISQVKTRLDIPDHLPPYQDWPETIDLRNRCLSFRFDYLQKIDPAFQVRGLEGYQPRLVEIVKPLFQITEEPEISPEIKAFLEEQQEYLLSQIILGDEGIAAKVIVDMDTKGKRMPSLKEITTHVNQMRTNQYPLNERKVGGLLKSLGFRSTRTRDGYVIPINPIQLQSIARRYGISISS